jgi:4-hydroxybenzoate polyprenyltransferase
MLTLVFFLLRYTVTLPLLQYSGIDSSLSDANFRLIVIATILIAAGGNIINDIFDIKPDAVNKPGKNSIGTVISKRNAYTLYFTLTAAGLFLAYWALRSEMNQAIYSIFPLSAGLLFFYSYSYKNIPLVGNLIISVLAALSVLTGILFDHNAMQPGPVFTLTCGYAVFAFLMTFARELIKDCQDIDGDMRFNSRTFPVVFGAPKARWIAVFILMLTLSLLGWIQFYSQQWENIYAFAYVTLLINLPLVILIIRTLKAQTPQQDGKNATLAKVIMLTGILSTAVFFATF